MSEPDSGPSHTSWPGKAGGIQEYRERQKSRPERAYSAIKDNIGGPKTKGAIGGMGMLGAMGYVADKVIEDTNSSEGWVESFTEKLTQVAESENLYSGTASVQGYAEEAAARSSEIAVEAVTQNPETVQEIVNQLAGGI